VSPDQEEVNGGKVCRSGREQNVLMRVFIAGQRSTAAFQEHPTAHDPRSIVRDKEGPNRSV